MDAVLVALIPVLCKLGEQYVAVMNSAMLMEVAAQIFMQ